MDGISVRTLWGLAIARDLLSHSLFSRLISVDLFTSLIPTTNRGEIGIHTEYAQKMAKRPCQFVVIDPRNRYSKQLHWIKLTTNSISSFNFPPCHGKLSGRFHGVKSL